MNSHFYYLAQGSIPEKWYQILSDFSAPLPPLRYEACGLTPQEHRRIRVGELVKQDLSNDRFIGIPQQVLERYEASGRPTPLFRAVELERYLDTPAEIYIKREDLLPTHSFKLNSAIAQAYYAKQDGFRHLVSETGAGQWGLSLSYAAKQFGLSAEIFWVKVSRRQKPYRANWAKLAGGTIFESPSSLTETGRAELRQNRECPGSLGISIGEAVEYCRTNTGRAYVSGSNLPNVILHQTVIGLEAKEQFRQLGIRPDLMVACCGGGSNLGGFLGPFIFDHQYRGTRFLAAESDAAPRLTKGEYRYDFPDPMQILPQVKSYTLGKDYMPPVNHTGGLRQHNGSSIIGYLRHHNLLEATALAQQEALDAGRLFSLLYGTIPAPESSHALAAVIRQAHRARLEHRKQVIAMCMSGCGVLDIGAYLNGGAKNGITGSC